MVKHSRNSLQLWAPLCDIIIVRYGNESDSNCHSNFTFAVISNDRWRNILESIHQLWAINGTSDMIYCFTFQSKRNFTIT